MAEPKRADPIVWGAVCALGVAALTLAYSLIGYHAEEPAAGSGGAFFLGMLAAWVRNIPLK